MRSAWAGRLNLPMTLMMVLLVAFLTLGSFVSGRVNFGPSQRDCPVHGEEISWFAEESESKSLDEAVSFIPLSREFVPLAPELLAAVAQEPIASHLELPLHPIFPPIPDHLLNLPPPSYSS